MKLSATSRSAPRLIKAGSVTLKIYSSRIGRYRAFTVYWRVAGRSHRKTFADEKAAQKFAREQAEKLSAGQITAPAISVTDAQTFHEAQRRLGSVDVPLHVVAGEYADIVKHLGENGTLRQAVEFFLHNAVRPDLIRTVSHVVEEFLATKAVDGLSKVYLEDCGLPSTLLSWACSLSFESCGPV
jgi:hypothetical protein